MKITQEVCDLHAKQNQPADAFMESSLSPLAGESDSAKLSGERGPSAKPRRKPA
jgi:hypothetical protein